METKSYLNIKNISKGIVMGGFFGKLNKRVTPEFPAKIGGYKFYKLFNSDQETSMMYSLALYRDGQGKKALAKMWTGVIQDLPFYTLLNEIAVFDSLNKVTNRERKLLNKNFKNIYVPKLLGRVIENKKIIMLVEYIENCRTADKLDNENAYKTLIASFDYLRCLGSLMTGGEKDRISTRSTGKILLFYPLLLLKSLVAHPELYAYLLKGIPFVVKSLPKLYLRKDLSLGHRDLHLRNILVSKTSKIYLVDLQFCVFSDDLYDFFFSIRHGFDNKYMTTKLLKELEKRYKVDLNTDWVRAFMIISATHGVSGGILHPDVLRNSINFLKFSVSGNNIYKNSK